jgi:plasmid stabilization system protein ParE
LEAIVRYIARRDPRAASSVGTGIYDRVEILLQQPEAGSVVGELREEGWRQLIFRRWKIVYQHQADAVTIGRIWPVAMGEIDLDAPLEA